VDFSGYLTGFVGFLGQVRDALSMRLTAKSEYGLLAVIDLACHAGCGPISAREIAERRNIPGTFLEQLLVSLRRAGIVNSVRGAHGGFVLAREPSEITVLHVVEALDGPLESPVCDAEPQGGCGRGASCAASAVWWRAQYALRRVLTSTNVADLASMQAQLDSAERCRG
jgi:Rrf2 family cysteine metabolism transcriptional repressor